MGLSLSVLLYFLYWSSIGLLVKETDATLDAEIKSLASQYNERGIQRLVLVIGAKVRRNKDQDMLYLLQSSSGKNIVGNLTQWPNISKKSVLREVKIAIQINGKTRDVISIKIDLTQKEVENIILKNSKIKKYVDNKKIIKTIFVKNKILNYIIAN